MFIIENSLSASTQLNSLNDIFSLFYYYWNLMIMVMLNNIFYIITKIINTDFSEIVELLYKGKYIHQYFKNVGAKCLPIHKFS